MPEVKKIIDTGSSLASFFHNSGIRTKELREIAKKKNLYLARLPAQYEVRWTQFVFQLIKSILKSWHTLVLFFGESKETEATGYLNFLKNKENLEFLSFLADVLEVFSHCQQNLQKDSLTLMDMMRYIRSTEKQLMSLLEKPLFGGWVEVLQEEMKYSEKNKVEEYKLKGILLNSATRRLKTHNLFVSVRRETSAIKNEIIQSLCNFLQQRFDSEEEMLIQQLENFVNFKSTVDLKEIYTCIASDLDMSSLSLEFTEIINIGLDRSIKDLPILEKIVILIKSNNYPVVTKVLSRIAAATPHSADVERLISCNNILKSSHRCSLDIKTENLYLYVYFNMPDLENWDPRPAVAMWLDAKARRTKTTEKAKNQRWFHGIFTKEQSQGLKKQKEDEKKPVAQKKKF